MYLDNITKDLTEQNCQSRGTALGLIEIFTVRQSKGCVITKHHGLKQIARICGEYGMELTPQMKYPKENFGFDGKCVPSMSFLNSFYRAVKKEFFKAKDALEYYYEYEYGSTTN